MTTIHSNFEIQISQVIMLFNVEPIDLNIATFNEDIGYYDVFEYVPLGGHVRKLSNEIHGKIYHVFEIDRSRLGEDLKEALKCQRTFAEVVYA